MVITRFVNVGSTLGGDGTTNDTSGPNRAFSKLKEAIDVLQSGLTEPLEIICQGDDNDASIPDTSGFTITGYATDATNFIRVTVPEDKYHQGISGIDGVYVGYTLLGDEANGANDSHIIIRENYTVFERVSFDMFNNSSGIATRTVAIESRNNGDNDGQGIVISGCIVFNGRFSGFRTTQWSSCTYINCMAWDLGKGGAAVESMGFRIEGNWDTDLRVYFYNCTAINADKGFWSKSSTAAGVRRTTIVNCLSMSNDLGDYSGQFERLESDYNISADHTIGAVTSGVLAPNSFSGEIGFLSTGGENRNYHLNRRDIVARNRGFDLNTSGVQRFTDDIDGETRVVPWDAGADEYQNHDRVNIFIDTGLGDEQGCSGVYYMYADNVSGSMAIPAPSSLLPSIVSSGQIHWVEASGLLMVSSGLSNWLTFPTLGIVTFNPNDISHLKVWYDASLETAFAHNDSVGTLTNFASSGSFDATQGTAGDQAVYITGALNSEPVFRFDTSDHYDVSVTNMGDMTIFTVFNITTISNSAFLGFNAVNNRYFRLTDTTTVALRLAGGGDSVSTAAFVNGTNHEMTMVRDIVADTMDIYKDNSSTAEGQDSNIEQNVHTISTVGIDGDGAGSPFGAGDLAEMLVYAKVLNSTELADVHAYLSSKYGI